MRINPTIACLALLTGSVIGFGRVPTNRAPEHHALKAMVRFSNELTAADTVGLAANGVVLFTGIAPGARTDYIALSDSNVTFTLRGGGADSLVARTKGLLLDQSSYTVVAINDGKDRPILELHRD